MKKSVPQKKTAKAPDYPGATLTCRPPLPDLSSDIAPLFSGAIIAWQRQHGRHDLPWQQRGAATDPYRVWLSEIMLQQTQVATVLPYYRRFLQRFPTLSDLAAAPIEDVMAHWAGLGYYARARNLHACAQQVVTRHAGCFPDHPQGLAELPGIGRSTAAAIAVFAFRRRAAILDGNVKRVLCRVFGVEGFPGQAGVERGLWALAEHLLPKTGLSAYTQGLMDLGATVCTPRRPACLRCPLAGQCRAHREGRVEELPWARPRKALPTRELGVLILRSASTVLLERRPSSGIWGGLWSLPELRDDEAAEQAVHRLLGVAARCHAGESLRHSFTHFRLNLHPWRAEFDAPPEPVTDGRARCWVAFDALDQHGMPAPIRVLLAANGVPLETLQGDQGMT